MESKQIEKMITDRDGGNQQANGGQAKELRTIFEDLIFEAYQKDGIEFKEIMKQPTLIRTLYLNGERRNQ